MTHDAPDNQQLTDAFGRLTERLQPPVTALEDDLTRGRRRGRRRVAALSTAGVLGIAVVTGIALNATGGSAPEEGLAVATGGNSSAPPTQPTDQPTVAVSDQPVAPPTTEDPEHVPSSHTVNKLDPQSTAYLTTEWLPIFRAALDPTGKRLIAEEGQITQGEDISFNRTHPINGVGFGWKGDNGRERGTVTLVIAPLAKPGCSGVDGGGHCTALPTPEGAKGAWTFKQQGITKVRVLRADGTAVTVASLRISTRDNTDPMPHDPVTPEAMAALGANPEVKVTDQMRSVTAHAIEAVEGLS